jgi:hypothetical protein
MRNTFVIISTEKGFFTGIYNCKISNVYYHHAFFDPFVTEDLSLRIAALQLGKLLSPRDRKKRLFELIIIFVAVFFYFCIELFVF